MVLMFCKEKATNGEEWVEAIDKTRPSNSLNSNQFSLGYKRTGFAALEYLYSSGEYLSPISFRCFLLRASGLQLKLKLRMVVVFVCWNASFLVDDGYQCRRRVCELN
ncbi:hypothetical protein VNO80_11571 [Phaseolus coccineus]|uniref:PH domain-containing protein n=1 Tax=Phaseolus coccineus TaxID=3886 RepID=A0AAN9NFF4_PHACN